MTTGEPPGFFTTLPVVALVGLLGCSLAVAYGVKELARRFGGSHSFPRTEVALIGLFVQVLVLTSAALGLFAIDGLPPGGLFGGQLPRILVIYGLPLVVASVGFSVRVARASGIAKSRRFSAHTAALFVVGHLATIPLVWATLVLVD